MGIKTAQITEIFEANAKALYRYAYSKLQSKEKAEDVVAETFARLLDQEGFDEATVKYWLFTVARNLIYDHYKKEAKVTSLEVLEDNIGEVAEDSAGVDETLLTADLVASTQEKLTELDELTREILVLKIWDDYTFGKIAELVNSSESGVKMRYYRGL